MQSAQLIVILAAILGTVVVLANAADRRPNLRPLLYVALLVLNFLFVVSFASLPLSPALRSTSDNAALTVLVALVFGGIATAVLMTPVRRRLAAIFPRPQTSADGRGFNPDSMVHMTALVYCTYLLGQQVLQFLVVGGQQGLAQDFNAPTVGSLWAQLALFLIFSFIGVGLGMRRRLPDAFWRLGLRAPTLSELLLAASTAFLLFSAQYIIANIWQAVTPTDIFQQQTQLSEELGASINTLSMGFLIAGTAALGEEIAFRGALQPIFGLWPTAILFAFIHIQYLLTPATLIIVIVGLGLGYLRQRYNTTAAIVAHFLYDFGLIALALYGRVLLDTLGGGR